nr:MAG TPA: hypothetical protein [Caudoviricetes sp.]
MFSFSSISSISSISIVSFSVKFDIFFYCAFFNFVIINKAF